MEEQFIIDLTLREKIKFALTRFFARVKNIFCKKTVINLSLDNLMFDEDDEDIII